MLRASLFLLIYTIVFISVIPPFQSFTLCATLSTRSSSGLRRATRLRSTDLDSKSPSNPPSLSDLDSQVLSRLLEDNPEYLTSTEVQRLLGETEALAAAKASEKAAYESTLPGAKMNSKLGTFLANWEVESGAVLKKLQDFLTTGAIAVSNAAESMGQALTQSVQNQFLLSADSSYEGLRNPADYFRVAAEAFEAAFALGPTKGVGGGRQGVKALKGVAQREVRRGEELR